MRLSKTTNYAIRVLLDCAQAGDDLVKVADISTRRDITPQNTFKIVHLLSRAGFVKAVRGRHGGVRLARPASKIRIGDVVRAIETLGFEGEDGAADKKGGSPQGLHHLLDSALGAFIGVLDGHTLEEMARVKRTEAPAVRGKARRPRTKPAAKSPGAYRRQHNIPH